MTIEEVEKKFDELGGIKPVRGTEFYPCSDDEIQSLETEKGERLSEPYRTLLAKYGNWSFNDIASFPYSDVTVMEIKTGSPYELSEDATLSYMYGGNEDYLYSLERSLETYTERMPETLIPVGDDGGGNKICLGVKGQEKGMVFFWDHENEWDEEDYLEEEGEPMPEEFKFQNVYLIANSFEEFLNQIKIEE